MYPKNSLLMLIFRHFSNSPKFLRYAILLCKATKLHCWWPELHFFHCFALFCGIAPCACQPHIHSSYTGPAGVSHVSSESSLDCLHASLSGCRVTLPFCPSHIFLCSLIISAKLYVFPVDFRPFLFPISPFLLAGLAALFFLFSPVSWRGLEQPVSSRCEEDSWVPHTHWWPWRSQHKTPTLLMSILAFTAQPGALSFSLNTLDLVQDIARVRLAQFNIKDCLDNVCHMTRSWFHIRQNLNTFTWKMQMWNLQQSYETKLWIKASNKIIFQMLFSCSNS